MSKKSVFHEPLRAGDATNRTVGCRHTNPDICGKHSLAGLCAFVRKDEMCLAPPATWSKQYLLLKAESVGVG